MNKIKFFASTLLLVVMGFMFVTCSESNEENDGVTNKLKSYMWEYREVSDLKDHNNGVYYETISDRFYFMDNNICYHLTVVTDHDSYFGDSQDSYLYEYTYSVSGSTVKVFDKDMNKIRYTLKYRGNYLISDDDCIYEPSVEMTQSQKDYIRRKAQEMHEEEENEPSQGGNNGNNEPSQGGNNGPSSGYTNGHEWVDLGLSVKWATYNVGASKPEDYGDYYAWGETTTRSDYNWDTYKWCKGTHDTMTKYCTDSDDGTVDNRTTLTSSDDVATVKWGSKWRMPTREEMEELDEDCTWTWTTQNGVKGMKVTGPNGNSIFLPAAGYRYRTDLIDRGSDGNYWSATLDEDYSIFAYYLYFYSGYGGCSSFDRSLGFTVRPVTE